MQKIPMPCSSRTLNVLFVRHCQAEHNVADEIAQKNACLNGTCPVVARLSVLNDSRHLDAPLSLKGRDTAQKAAGRICKFVENLGAPHVLVSPLRRARETASCIFPESVWGKLTISPQNLVRERLTGRPCDFLKEEYEANCSASVAFDEEDNIKLGERCSAFLKVLLESNFDQELVAVVTHKAFLRELDNQLRKHWHVCGADIECPKIFGNSEARLYSFSVEKKKVNVRTCKCAN